MNPDPFDPSRILICLCHLDIDSVAVREFWQNNLPISRSTRMGSRFCFSQRDVIRVSDYSIFVSKRCVMSSPFFDRSRLCQRMDAVRPEALF